MIWYDIWYDMIWYDMIYDMIWYDMIWYDMIWYDMIWYDMIWYIYLLKAVGLSPGSSAHFHTKIHRPTQITTNVEECGPCPVFASFTLAFALKLRKKHWNTSVRVRKTSVRVQYTYYKYSIHITSTVYILHIDTYFRHQKSNVKYIYSKAIPLQVRRGLEVFRRLRLSGYLDNEHIKVVRLSALRTDRLYPQERFVVLIFVVGWVDSRTVERTKLCQRKIPMTPLGIEPTNFLLVAQCLNQLRYGVPHISR